MKIDSFDFQSLLLVKWSPILLPIAVGLSLLTTLWIPLSTFTLLVMIIIALCCSITVVLSKLKESFLLTMLDAFMFFAGGEVLRRWLFPGEVGWLRSLQFSSIVFAVLITVLSVCGLMQKESVEE